MVSQLGSQVENAAIDNVSNNEDGIDPSSAMEDVVQLETPSASSGAQSNTPQESDTMILENNGDLIVGDRFWTIFCGEVERIFEAARGPEPYSFEIHNDSNTETDSHSRSHINYYSFLLRQADAAAKYDLIHPHPSQLLLLWQAYVDDIDPFIKVLHVPSMTRLIRGLRGQYHSLKPTTEALIFAICLAAVSVSTEEDICQHFNTNKQELLSRYQLCAEQTFEKIGILTSDSIESVQALGIYTYTLRANEEQKLVWTLSGILIRKALRLNLHNDTKTSTGITALEKECKRRLWWHICLTDSTSNSGIAGVSKFLVSDDMFDTPMPSNIDDANISNSSFDIPNLEPRRTDLTIFLIRCEVWRLSRRLQTLVAARKTPQGMSQEDPVDFFENARIQITENRLKHLNSDIPIDCFMNTMTHLFFSKVELRLLENYSSYNEGTSLNLLPPAQDKIFTLALSILNHTYSLQHESAWKPWRWHIRDQTPPYHALSIVLNTICRQQWDSKFEQALSSAIRSVTTIPERIPQHNHFTKLLTTAQFRTVGHVVPTSTGMEVSNQSNPTLSTSVPTHDETAPIYTDDFDFTIFGDIRTSTSANLETWDDIAHIFEPWDFVDIGGI
ncbi:uncharacterized protein DFL_006369 [Arthrobotrys flagrans]|uniref:Xylanolytic transcriptional activator regulatory domain-containing protein n=1 Tax=Arthrobotrys flagrans TaxID=97331 RepID=A0A437A035_ARTFL|nr:hypothetical protein DFL_006369 [Arthrobotrys flagrans]